MLMMKASCLPCCLQSVELALGADQPAQELQELHKSCALQLSAMTSTVRGRLTDLERQVRMGDLQSTSQFTGNLLAEARLCSLLTSDAWTNVWRVIACAKATRNGCSS
jgi:hypothetical protein